MTNFNSKTSKFIGLSFFTLQILNSKSYLRFKSWGSKNRKQPPRLFFKIGFLQLQLQIFEKFQRKSSFLAKMNSITDFFQGFEPQV